MNVPFLDVVIHESAEIEPGCSIGAGTQVWHFAHVRCGAQIGADCMLGKGVYVGETARVGHRVRIQNGVSIFNGVTLENEVFVGPSVVFTNDRFPRAVQLIDPDFATTLVRHGATLGAGSVIRCGIEIGRYAMVGAGAVVTRDVPAHACVVGNPARCVGWVCRCGRRLIRRVPEGWECSVCGRGYEGGERTEMRGVDDDFSSES